MQVYYKFYYNKKGPAVKNRMNTNKKKSNFSLILYFFSNNLIEINSIQLNPIRAMVISSSQSFSKIEVRAKIKNQAKNEINYNYYLYYIIVILSLYDKQIR